MVIAGRDHLRWPEDWLEQDEKGRRLWLEEHLVGGLSRIDALEFLHRSDVEDWPAEGFVMPQELQAAILRVTDEKADEGSPSSHHCYLLALCAEIVTNTKAETGGYPEAAVFDQIPEGADAAEPLVSRFLTSLHSQSMVLWLEELSLTPRFNEEYALSLDAQRRHNNGRAGWERLRQLSFLGEREMGFWEMHRLLRESLRKRVNAEDAKAIHIWSENYWWQKAGEEDWKRKGLSWFHLRFTDRKDALSKFTELVNQAKRRAEPQTMRQLIEWWRDIELNFEPADLDQAADLFTFGSALNDLSIGNQSEHLRRAIACYEAALRVYTEADYPADWAMNPEQSGHRL